MADSKGRKYGNVHYNRERTWVERELLNRGYKDRDIWVLVSPIYFKGKNFDKDELDKLFDNRTYTFGTQIIENIAMACDVSFMTVVDWIRLDRYPEKMTKGQLNVYKRRLSELEAPDRIRWYIVMLCRKGFPLLQIVEAAAQGYDFKQESNLQERNKWVYNNLISKGIKIDPAKRKVKKKKKED